MIQKKTVDEVLDRMDVVEVLQDFIDLKKSGTNYKALSPFSNERTPSLMVSPVKQIWKDFSSGKGGNAINFLMEHQMMDFPECIRHLANKYGIEVLEEVNAQEQAEKHEREQLFIINEKCQEFYSKNLFELNAYLIERDISAGMAQLFEIGFAPNTLNALANILITLNGFSWEKCVVTGALGIKNNTIYDRFRNRIMFPIRSHTGTILGFGGRDLNWQKGSNSAKYLNSSDSLVYNKSKILYGLFQTKKYIIENDHCYLVEGYTDVIGFFQIGIQNIVAASGTSFTIEQAKLIKRFCSKVTILFDGDKAGNQASLRTIDYLIAEDISIKICILPNGEDPDSFRKGKTKEQVLEYIKSNSKDFIIFKLTNVYNENDDFTLKGQAINEVIGSISKIKNAIQREVYLKECSRITDMDMVLLRIMLNQNTEDNFVFSEISIDENIENDRKTRSFLMNECEKRIIRYVLEFGNETMAFRELMMYYDSDWEEFKNSETEISCTVKEKISNDIINDGLSFSNIDHEKIFHICCNNDISDVNQWNYIFGVELFPIVDLIFSESKNYEVSSFDNNSLMTSDIIFQEKRQSIPKSISEALLHFKFLNIEVMIESMLKDPEPDIDMIIGLSELSTRIKSILNIVL